ncbi:signal peptidase I [Rhodococcus sp. BE178]|uniref:signal peptidase I n=2 Tax=unclassified Rhodococcus (in: high G+C Gram-positive bacteria) TaxID=192944 RepID=UPI003D1B760C
MSDNEKASRRPRSISWLCRETALTIGAVAGVICIVATVAAMVFGVKPLIFRSGSMSPEITTGSLALSRNVPATDLKVGDVVSVENTQGTRITHRVHALDPQAGGTVLVTLKGDANQDPDIEPYAITEADRVFTSVGGLGYVVAWLSSPAALLLGGAFVGALLMIVVRPAKKNDDDSDDDQATGPGSSIEDAATTEFVPVIESKVEPMSPTKRFSVPSARSILAISAAALSVLGITQATMTAAALTDNATAAASFSTPADMLAAPKWLGCSGSGGSVTMKWAHLGPGYTYDVKLVSGWGGSWNPTIPQNKGDVVSISVSAYDNVYETASSSRIEVRAKRDGQIGSGWVGENMWAFTLWNIKCDGATSDGNQVQGLTAGTEALNARMAGPVETTTTPSSTTAAPSSTTSPQTTTSTTTTAPTTSDTTASTTTTTTTPPTTASETSETTTTTTTTTTPPATTTTAADTPLGTSEKSQSRDYSALLVNSAETSQTAIVIEDANGEELERIPASASAHYEWDSSTDALWIVDNGKLYKATGSTWNKTAVDPSSTDVPADIAALIE